MKRIASILLILLTACCSLFAQFTEADKPLMDAYLENNMQRWKNYIDATNWEKLRWT